MKQGLHEMVRVQQIYAPGARSATLTDYNATTQGGASGIDLQGYDECMIELELGAFAGGTLDVDLLESATDSAAAATLITDSASTEADFAQKTSANANNPYVVRIRAKDVKRYLFIRVINSSGDAKNYAISALLGKADSEPVSQVNTVDFAHDVA